jgi:hypothetical protein
MNLDMIYSFHGMKWKRQAGSLKWILAEDFSIQTEIRPEKEINFGKITLYVSGLLVLHAGYAWDGATGVFDTLSNMIASAVHDAGCVLVRASLIAPDTMIAWNNLYKKLCKRDGMSRWRFRLHRLGLKLYWKRHIEKLYKINMKNNTATA